MTIPDPRVLVVEDQPLNMTGISAYLANQGMEIREAVNGSQALQVVREWEPHAVVLDIAIPGHSGEDVNIYEATGIQIARQIKSHRAEIGIVLYTNYPGYYRSDMMQMLSQGYQGLAYLFKSSRPQDLRDMIYRVIDGWVGVDPHTGGDQFPASDIGRTLTEQESDLIQNVLHYMHELTEREMEVVKWVASARRNIGIAKELQISENTVERTLNSVFEKVGLKEIDPLFDKRALLGKAYLIFCNTRPNQGKRLKL